MLKRLNLLKVRCGSLRNQAPKSKNTSARFVPIRCVFFYVRNIAKEVKVTDIRIREKSFRRFLSKKSSRVEKSYEGKARRIEITI
jgi:hypothetical protein